MRNTFKLGIALFLLSTTVSYTALRVLRKFPAMSLGNDSQLTNGHETGSQQDNKPGQSVKKPIFGSKVRERMSGRGQEIERKDEELTAAILANPDLVKMLQPSFMTGDGKLNRDELKLFGLSKYADQLEALSRQSIASQNLWDADNYKLLKSDSGEIIIYVPEDSTKKNHETYLQSVKNILPEPLEKVFTIGTERQMEVATGGMGNKARMIKIKATDAGYHSDVKVLTNNAGNRPSDNDINTLPADTLWKSYGGSSSQSESDSIPKYLSHMVGQ